MEQEENTPFNAAWIVRSSQFELFFAAVIVANSFVMAVQAIYDGIDVGNKIGFVGYESTAAECMPGASEAFTILEMVFGILFTVEVVLKIVGLKLEFVMSLWNWFDAFLVVVWIIDTVLRSFPLDTNLLRLVRLARLMRLVKIARAVQGFDSLVVMTTALQGSLFALIWVFVLLLCIQMLFALLLGQLLTIYIDTDPDLTEETRLKIFEYFGTFPRATLTMFELTLGNFAPVARVLQEHVSQAMVVFNLFHKVTFGFACVGVVNGVFMQETLKVAQNDDSMMMRTVQNRKRQHAKKMHDFFQYADNSGDGSITKDEWTHVLSNEKAQDWFAGQGLTVQDADLLFDLLETSGDGSLTSDELARGVSRLAGPSKSFDVLASQREQNLVNAKTRTLISEISARLQDLQDSQLQLGQMLHMQQVKEQPCESQNISLKDEVIKLREALRGYNEGRGPKAMKSKSQLYEGHPPSETSDFVHGI
eukprot:TRINITY_DN33315_c0_g1_i1.p1 TRINITY_DN33315_c0_g1~~TRINITY_DN33315_c0_g1_i1.p1  ORF type:complete len:487 (-),score=103.47 TRINITY_DN33315_c0_g1_i1:217-1647(-)